MRPFLEIAPLAGLKMHDDDGGRGASGGGAVVGIGVGGGQALRGRGVRQRDQGRHGGAHGLEANPCARRRSRCRTSCR
jgi:hypothetical protein